MQTQISSACRFVKTSALLVVPHKQIRDLHHVNTIYQFLVDMQRHDRGCAQTSLAWAAFSRRRSARSDVESGSVRLHHFWKQEPSGVLACSAASQYPNLVPRVYHLTASLAPGGKTIDPGNEVGQYPRTLPSLSLAFRRGLHHFIIFVWFYFWG